MKFFEKLFGKSETSEGNSERETDGETFLKTEQGSLKGTIKSIEDGAVNMQIVIELSNGLEVVSIITKDSTKRLDLTAGKEVYAVVKASDVMIAID